MLDLNNNCRKQNYHFKKMLILRRQKLKNKYLNHGCKTNWTGKVYVVFTGLASCRDVDQAQPGDSGQVKGLLSVTAVMGFTAWYRPSNGFVPVTIPGSDLSQRHTNQL